MATRKKDLDHLQPSMQQREGGAAAYIQRNRRKKGLRKVQGEERSDASFATHMLSIGAFCHKSCYRKLDDKGMLRI